MALKAHCDGCDRVLTGSALAALSSGATAAASDVKTASVLVTVGHVEHLCHPCRKRILTSAIEELVIAEWWDPA